MEGRASQLVILDHGLYHRLDDFERLRLCELILACCSPWPSRAQVRAAAEPFVGPGWRMMPLLLSPAFALASDLTIDDLHAASQMRLPPSVTLDTVRWVPLLDHVKPRAHGARMERVHEHRC